MARPSRKRCRRLRRSRRRSEKSRNSGNSKSLLVSFWEPVRRSVGCGLLKRRRRRNGKKNGRIDPARDHARSRAVLTDSVRGSAQEGAAGSGGDRDSYALGLAPRGCRRLEPAARISGPRRRRAHATLFLRPTSPLPRTAQQARADGLGVGGSFASLLFVRALWPRAISRRRRTGYREYGILSRSTRMQAMVGQEAPFDDGREQMKILAGLEVTTKSVERTAEAIGTDIAQREQAE